MNKHRRRDWAARAGQVGGMVVVIGLSGCAIQQMRAENESIYAAANEMSRETPRARPVARVHDGAFLLGEKVPAMKPQPEIYNRPIVFKEKRAMRLQDLALWLSSQVGVPVDVESSAYAAIPGQSAAPGASAIPAASAAGPLPQAGIPVQMALGTPLSSPLGSAAAMMPMTASAGAVSGGPAIVLPAYTGDVRGFTEIVNSAFQVWTRYRDGRVSIYRSETRTFPLPSIADTSEMSGQISSGQTGSGATGGGSSGGASTGVQSMSLSVKLSPWATLKETASAIAGVPVVVDQNLGMMTVTGTPPQCDRVEAFVKDLATSFGKQVVIDVHVYEIRRNREDNYGANLQLAFKNSTGHTGVSLKSATIPTLLSSASPLQLGATILSGPLAGSSATIQALSTLGSIAQEISRAGVTQNGKQLGLQVATLQDYVSQSQTTITPNVGTTTSLLTSTAVPGFTGSFLPKVVNGRILVDFDMTLSSLQLQSFSSGGDSPTSVQLRTMPLARFQQAVGLQPGETLVLTGVRQRTSNVTNNGVGTPENVLFGGGVDAQSNNTILAVSITAHLL
ncbi:pilus assembly protein PilN [Cupriavidus basilensis]|uniref:pilus assembly protein PilN n=1 Tax=Cupriavidus basilensis TaxID=68895 RepID=UPI0023E7AD77|nr:pilus assembly protein PilN [Cupriavidus basilensis]MDF3883116.1 pilus assembly protein PilN [Cupriavidus basilensis]